jgi:hypothetical protein
MLAWEKPLKRFQPLLRASDTPLKRMCVNLSFGGDAAFLRFLAARENQGVFVFNQPFPLLAFTQV